jgi:hypothetical protein
VIVYFAPLNERSVLVARAMHEGIGLSDPTVQLMSAVRYRGRPEADVAVFYGLASGLGRILRDYRAAGRKAVYIDLGYWHRKNRTRFDGFHKLVINGRHPTDYFQARAHPHDRLAKLGVDIAPRRAEGRQIIVAGMSAKAAAVEGLRPQQWEQATINRLRQLSPRPIVYRPKPNWLGSSPIPGSIYEKGTSLEAALRGAHAVVTHHSNVAVDAILAGIPAICPEGVAAPMSGKTLEEIETPPMPDGRAQWAADIAYCQWTIAEMQNGLAWRHLIEEGLI